MAHQSQSIPFEKLDACGNDFVLLEADLSVQQVGEICDRHHGIGADGVMVFHRHAEDWVCLNHYDPDGSRSFCLNGVRSTLACLFQKDLIPQSGKVSSEGVSLEYRITEGLATVRLEKSPYQSYTWRNGGHAVAGFKADVGNPHFIMVNGPSLTWFREHAAQIRGDLEAFPAGVNVSLVRSEGDVWRIYTYERGVEGFTKACGSGMYAASLALLGEGADSSFRFVPEGKGEIFITDHGKYLELRGSSNWVASGVWLCGC